MNAPVKNAATIPQELIDKARDNIARTVGSYVKLTKRGAEHTACCPFHDETTPSFTVNEGKGFYHCFGCGAHGDAIEFVMNYTGKGFRDAVETIVGSLPTTGAADHGKAGSKRPAPAVWRGIRHAPGNAPAPRFAHCRLGEPAARWEYRDTGGQLLGYVARFDYLKDDGRTGKETLPLCWAVNTDTGETAWRWLSFPTPRPLYGLPDLAARPDAPVLVVEGEKTRDAAALIFPRYVVVAWPGGGKAVQHADFSPLAGRDVTLWPDWDWQNYPERHQLAGTLMPEQEQPGIAAMRAVWEAIASSASRVRIVPPLAGCPDGWDLADAAPTPDFSPLAYAKQFVCEAAAYFAQPAAGQQPPEASEPPPAPPPANDNEPPPQRPDADSGTPFGFTVLGYDRDCIYLFPHEAKQIKELTKGDLTENGLLALAPIEFWQSYFPKKAAPGFCKTTAVDWLFRTAYQRGVFNPDRIRGRGAWRDGQRIVFHLGDRLHTDGEYREITELQSRYIYQAERPYPRFDHVAALCSDEGEALLDLARMFRWRMPASAALLAGWCAIAPVCGALRWRPHIWITGGAGSGKSTILEQYVNGLIGTISVYAQGNSTEAGLRQEIRGDAVPVLFDESEQNNERETQRMQQVLALIRQASSESGARTFKGTTGGSATHYHIRSMFCLASIQVGIQHQADRERLTVLALREKDDSADAGDNWRRIRDALYNITRDPEYHLRLLNRIVNMLPTVLASIDVFVAAAAKHFGNQRTGDQYGTLLAGAWCLTSTRVPAPAEAAEWIAGYDWQEYTEPAKANESERALQALLDARIRTAHGSEYTVFELLDRIAVVTGTLRNSEGDTVCQLDLRDAQAALQRHGMKVVKGALMIAHSSDSITRLVTGTAYAADLRGLLARLPSVTGTAVPTLINGKTSRCISIPLADLV